MTHGGKRNGAGRPKVLYKTTTIRIPVPCKKLILAIVKKFKENLK